MLMNEGQMILNLKIQTRYFALAGLIAFFPVTGHAMDPTQCKRGAQALDAKRIDEAIKLFTQCIEQGNLNEAYFAFAYLNRGSAFRHIGKLDKSIQDLSKALTYAPNNADALAERGTTWIKQNNADMAIKDFTAAIQVNPKHLKSIINRGLLYEALGQNDKALNDFQTAYDLGSRWQPIVDKLAQHNAQSSTDSTYEISFPLPDDFKLAFKRNDDQGQMYQYVPKGESLQKWGRMFTVVVSKLKQPIVGIEKAMTQNTINTYISQCGSAQSTAVAFPAGNIPSYAEAGYCDDVDKSKIPPQIHVRNNGFILAKSYTAENVVYSFQYEWQSDTEPSTFVKTSGLLKKDIMPLMSGAVVTKVVAGKTN